MSQWTNSVTIQRWTPSSRYAIVFAGLVLVLLALAPLFASNGLLDRLTALFIYVILAAMWNALAGYGGLISVGQQAFFGLGAYFTIRIADLGLDPFISVALAALIVGVISYPISLVMLRLKGGEFAIGMWVVASILHLMVNLDGLIQGETGISLVSLNHYDSAQRLTIIYLLTLGSMAGLLALLFFVLRSKTGSAIQAIRDNEEAATSVGVKPEKTKQLLFVIAAFGIGVAGALWLTSATTFLPKTYFSVQWSAYMIFMVLVGGIGKFEGAILGAIIFFLVETWFSSTGVWYLVSLGAIAIAFSLFLPKGIWGELERRFNWHFLPVGYQVVEKNKINTDKK
ncbi:branched-chain amino acid ABC transporter permease [Marinomonas pollencensis]|uniref:Amino acid/amide ABC transporter membrane protein 2 (HAAT family) n=1 Tax=Marinomonas pollencensis TaxID=491954 RepID=A0A3E0DGT6_9GAMM|nr:branched-chain amino acid ABC transporter permease [Marinomonas pollencensis]REG81932.1 amino acid/amide ABC transporter membrane protein 2 (HAAT family) [Marinomonas pollencensis]